MRHKPLITIILLSLFIATQIVGLFVINAYTPQIETNENNETINTNPLPYGMEPPQEEVERPGIFSIIISFAVAILIIFLLVKYQWKFFLRAWFLIVVILAMGISINAFLKGYINNAALIAVLLAIPLGIYKVFKPNALIHNATELLVYPGIAVIFVPLLFRENAQTFLGAVWPTIAILILISIYDMWAVWHSGIMQKMAKFQMEEVRVFGGLFIPSISKKVKQQIKKMKKNKKKMKNKKFKVQLAILGGGDIAFPLIVAGVFLRTYGLLATIPVTMGAFAGLTFLLIISKKKFYPAMPFISAGTFLGMLISWLLYLN